jgi:hypothetical protein
MSEIMSTHLEKGRNINLVFKIILILLILGAAFIIAIMLNFAMNFFIGVLVGGIGAALIGIILLKMPKIYVKVSKY